MDTQKLIDDITRAVKTYIADEEMYDDNTQVVINPADGVVSLETDDTEDDLDESLDRYDVMDLLRMDADGHWTPDADAIRSAAEQTVPD